MLRYLAKATFFNSLGPSAKADGKDQLKQTAKIS